MKKSEKDGLSPVKKRLKNIGLITMLKLPRRIIMSYQKYVFEIEVRNKISGKTTTLAFHTAGRRGRFRIYENGELWAVGGWSEALAHIRKRCKRTPLYIN